MLGDLNIQIFNMTLILRYNTLIINVLYIKDNVFQVLKTYLFVQN
jgi:hypothetical protein